VKITREFFLDYILICLAFSLGFIAFKNSTILPKCHISNFIHYKANVPFIVKGIIVNTPELKNGKGTFLFKAEEIQSEKFNHSCCGNILVNLKEEKKLNYGKELVLRGNLYRPFSKTSSSGVSYKEYLYNQGIYLVMNVKTAADLIELNKNKGFILRRLAFWLKEKMEAIIYRNTSKLTAAILDAMVLGEKNDVPWFVNYSMMKSGTLHILVVSGFNVGIILFIVLLALKLIRIPRMARFLIAVPVLIIYCLITGASNPVVRATIMAAVFIGAYLIKREPDIYNALAIAAVFILMINPRQLFDIGFQLSFASVLSIVCLYPKLKSLLRVELLKVKLLKFFLEGCLVSFSAWLGTMGFIAYYFRTFSPITVLANIFIVPLATLITLSGISLMIVGSISPALARIFAFSTELEVFVLLKINAFLVSLPFAYFSLP